MKLNFKSVRPDLRFKLFTYVKYDYQAFNFYGAGFDFRTNLTLNVPLTNYLNLSFFMNKDCLMLNQRTNRFGYTVHVAPRRYFFGANAQILFPSKKISENNYLSTKYNFFYFQALQYARTVFKSNGLGHLNFELGSKNLNNKRILFSTDLKQIPHLYRRATFILEIPLIPYLKNLFRFKKSKEKFDNSSICVNDSTSFNESTISIQSKDSLESFDEKLTLDCIATESIQENKKTLPEIFLLEDSEELTEETIVIREHKNNNTFMEKLNPQFEKVRIIESPIYPNILF
uniref:Uncharacterized protein n=1 Tax=Avrainvillea sp. HV04061 TaxID=2364086 RepID=A0A3B8CLE9_9CHLO|nr:hypothetical protein [Avrainvillea sp. HV04061]